MTEPRRDLESVQIPEPCNADWASMHGDDRKRFCDQCQLHVHNVSAMPREEAEALVAKRDDGERVCVRMEVEADGTCVTAETPREVPAPRAAALALAFGGGLLAACRGDEPRAPEDPEAVENAAVESGEGVRIGQVLMGDVALPVDENGAEVQDEDCAEPTEPQGVLMGRIAPDGSVHVNADGQLTEGGAASEELRPTLGEVAPTEGDGAAPMPEESHGAATPEPGSTDEPLATQGHEPGTGERRVTYGAIGDTVPREHVRAPAGPLSGPTAPGRPADATPPKRRAIMGTPGPSGPKPKR